MRRKNPGGPDNAIQILRTQSMLVGNTMSSGRGIHETREAWLVWWQQTDAQLRNLFVESMLADELYRAQLEVQHLGDQGNPYRQLGRVVEVWRDKLAGVADQLKNLQPFVARPGNIVVPDTSAFLEGEDLLETNLQELAHLPAGEAVRLIISILVIEELDGLKRFGHPRARQRARELLRSCGLAPFLEVGFARCAPGTSGEVLLDDRWHVRLPVNDVESGSSRVYR